MNDTQQLHRDIYVGMVAEEMARSGYYGEDVTLCGFLAGMRMNRPVPKPICWRWQQGQALRGWQMCTDIVKRNARPSLRRGASMKMNCARP